MTHLAISIAALDTDSALAAMHQAAATADLVELRLDHMPSFDLLRLLTERPLPVIVTCRPPREGGRWQGSEAERLAVLRQAASLGANYVDLEWDCAAQAATLDRSRTRLILSRHDFGGMPADLPSLAAGLWAAGADVVKLVGTARRLADIVPVLKLLEDATRPTVAIAMGQSGLATRLLAFRYRHAFLSFAAPDPARVSGQALPATAPGQVTAQAMRNVYRVKAITRRTGWIGFVAPDANTSPLVEQGNHWLEQGGCNAVLLPLQLDDGEDVAEALDALRAVLPLRGALLQPPFGCAARRDPVRNTVRRAHGRETCAFIPDLAGRLRWITTGHMEASRG